MLYKKYQLFLEAKIVEKSKNTTEYKEIDYENGIIFSYHIVDDKFIESNRFINTKSGSKKYFYHVKDITPFQETHWDTHYELVKTNVTTIKSEKEALEFNDFEHLYYLGMGSDGMIMDSNLRPITSLIINLEFKLTSEEYKKYHPIFSSSPYVRNLTIEDSWSHYDDDEGDGVEEKLKVLKFDTLIPQKAYEEILKKSTHVGFEEKNKIIEFIKNDVKKHGLLY